MKASRPGTAPSGCLFDVQRFSVHDGPGVRTTVFLKGCPLRCAWCQNPESISGAPELMLYPDLCVGCGACSEVCPAPPAKDAATCRGGEMAASRPDSCLACGRCASVCPTGARRIAGREIGAAEAVELALRDRPFFRECGPGRQGGVTLSGGEPLAQWEFAGAMAVRLREEGVHVALDTACAAPREVIEKVPRCFDLVIADVKASSPRTHRTWTGVGNSEILDAVRFLSRAMPGRLWVSVPLIPGVHDPHELAQTAEVISSLAPPAGEPPPVRLIPYHRLGDSKYRALGRAAPEFPSSFAEATERPAVALGLRAGETGGGEGGPGSVDDLARAAAGIFRDRGLRILEE